MLSEKEIREKANIYASIYWQHNNNGLTDYGTGYLAALCDVLGIRITELPEKENNHGK